MTEAETATLADIGYDHHAAGAYSGGLEQATHTLATIYADHPDYRAEWRP